jgi:hypothetical protein
MFILLASENPFLYHFFAYQAVTKEPHACWAKLSGGSFTAATKNIFRLTLRASYWNLPCRQIRACHLSLRHSTIGCGRQDGQCG